MDYQLLKINGITKLCDDRILFDEKKNILDEQWFDFQLHFICDVLGIPLSDPAICPPIYTEQNPRPIYSNYTDKFTRNQIFRSLVDKYGFTSDADGSKIVTIPDSDILQKPSLGKSSDTEQSKLHSDDLLKFGISSTILYRLYNTSLNKDNGTRVEPISFLDTPVRDNKYYTDDLEEYNKHVSQTITEITSTSAPKENSTDLVDVLISSSLPKKDEPVSSKKQKPVRRRKKQPKSSSDGTKKSKISPEGKGEVSKDLPDRAITMSNCSDIGRLTWTRNGCYADSIIYLFFLRMYLNPNSSIYTHLLNPIEADTMNDKRCVVNGDEFGPPIPIADNVVILNNIRRKYIDILESLKQGDLLTIEPLRSLMGQCGGPDTSKWNGSDTQPTQTFTDDLLRLLQYKFPSEMSGMSSESRVGKYIRYYFSSDNSSIDKIKASILKEGESNFNRLYDAVGDKIYDNNLIHEDHSPVHFQTVYISAEDLIWKAMVTSEKKPLDEATLLTLNKSQIYKDPFTHQYFRKSDKQYITQLYKDFTIPINTILSPNRITDTSQEDARSFYITKDGYELDQNSNYYYKIDEPGHMISTESFVSNNIGYKVALKLEKSILTNTSDDILIFINRLIGHDDASSKRCSIKITDIETITLSDGTVYHLNGLVYWKGGHFMSIYNCKGVYYHYNDLPAGKGEIVQLGNYDEMINWRNGTILAAQENSAIYHYIKAT